VYGTDASPWQHALPWGDVTVKGRTMFLSVFEWPVSGQLYLPGLKTGILSARLLDGKEASPIKVQSVDGWIQFRLPARAPETLVSVIELQLAASPQADPVWGIDPGIATEILSDFATVQGAAKEGKRWMEKFGEWKHVTEITNWEPDGKATWEVDVLTPGDYQIELTYAGEGRLVWGVTVQGGGHIQNQQNSSHNYQRFPMGWLNFPAPGRYQVSVSCLEGAAKTASLKAIQFTRVQ
jgi:alpha-L-fucosidase